MNFSIKIYCYDTCKVYYLDLIIEGYSRECYKDSVFIFYCLSVNYLFGSF